MSIQFHSKTDLDIPSKPKVNPNPSASKKVSPKLESIRDEIMRTCGVVSQLPVSEGEMALHLINDYTGADPDQEAAVSKSLFQFVLKNFKDSNPYAPMDSSVNMKAFNQIFFQKMMEKLALRPFMLSSSIEAELNGDLNTIMSASFETLKDLMKNDPNSVPKGLRNQMREFLSEDVVGEFKKLKLKAYLKDISDKFSQKHTVLKKDWPYLTHLIKDIIAMQKKICPLLPPVSYTKGKSQNFTFAIQKDGQLRGYLCGTMHYLDEYGANEIAKITPAMQKRLYECAILGTEVALSSAKGVSVDKTLVNYAEKRGIANMGIDDEDRDFLSHDYLEDTQMSQSSPISAENFLHDMFEAQYYGDAQLMQSRISLQESYAPLPKKDYEITARRNKAMADNIDQLLKACHAVGEELQEKEPRAFFAVGINHLFSSKAVPESVVELLQKKGWTVELIPSAQS